MYGRESNKQVEYDGVNAHFIIVIDSIFYIEMLDIEKHWESGDAIKKALMEEPIRFTKGVP